MPLVPSSMASSYDAAMSNLMTSSAQPTQTQILNEFVNAYDTHAKTGICTTVTIIGTGKASLLSALSVTNSSSSNVSVLGNALASYWAAEITPLAPHTSVTNNAAGMGSAFAGAIQTALLTTTSNTSISPLIEETDKIVKTILYTGIIPGTPPVTVIASVS